MMDKRWVRRFAGLLFVFVCVMLVWRVPVKAATAWDENDIRLIMNQAFENGELEAVVTLERTFSPDEYQAKAEADAYASQMVVYLEDAALKNGKLMNGVSYSYVIIEGREITYRFDISPQFTKEVTVLTSERSAYRQALLALRQRDYKTNFYSEGALYYETFVLALQHHPEYNYNLVIWKGSDGTCGYRPGKELDEGEIRSKMTRTDTKADAIIKKIIKKGMGNKEKLQAIHDYLVHYCVYDEQAPGKGYDDSYTAYGCLVRKTAVCQGYAAAFNLLAIKAGICSITVAGEAGGGSHAWNYVRVGSTYRYVDATWDDPLPDRGSKAGVPHKYFYVTQSLMAKNHKWDKVINAKKYVDYADVLR